MVLPRQSLQRRDVADVGDDGSGLVGAVGAVGALLVTLDEGDLAVGFAEVRGHKPAAGGGLAGRLDGMPDGPRYGRPAELLRSSRTRSRYPDAWLSPRHTPALFAGAKCSGSLTLM